MRPDEIAKYDPELERLKDATTNFSYISMKREVKRKFVNASEDTRRKILQAFVSSVTDQPLKAGEIPNRAQQILKDHGIE